MDTVTRPHVPSPGATMRMLSDLVGRRVVVKNASRLAKADIAFARVSDCAHLSAHPHLRRVTVETPSGPAAMPAPAPVIEGTRRYGRVPALGEHTEKVRAEFLTNRNEGKTS